jgi:hypothetical protein
MGRSIYHPDVFPRYINKKRQQLAEIQVHLQRLPLDHPSRHRLLERMLHLQKGIPELEAEYEKRGDIRFMKAVQIVNGDFAASDQNGELDQTPGEVTQTAPGDSNPSTTDVTQKTRRNEITRRLEAPQSYKILSIADTALHFYVQPRTIHRWLDNGKLSRGVRRGSVSVKSILKLEKRVGRKPRRP